MNLSFAFHALAPACNLLRYLMKCLLMFRFHLYNFASLVDLLTGKSASKLHFLISHERTFIQFNMVTKPSHAHKVLNYLFYSARCF